MREVVDTRAALLDVGTLLSRGRPQRFTVPQRESLDEDDRLRRRDQVVHTLEVTRRRRRRRALTRVA